MKKNRFIYVFVFFFLLHSNLVNAKSLGRIVYDLGIGVTASVIADKVMSDEPSRGQKYMIGFFGKDLNYFTHEGTRYHYGVIVDSLTPNMPAEEVGLRVGDILYKIDDINIQSIKHLSTYLNNRNSPWSVVTLKFIRQGNLYQVNVEPRLYPH